MVICRPGIGSLPAWTGEELLTEAIQKPPETQKTLFLFGAGNKTFPWASQEQSRSLRVARAAILSPGMTGEEGGNQ